MGSSVTGAFYETQTHSRHDWGGDQEPNRDRKRTYQENNATQRVPARHGNDRQDEDHQGNRGSDDPHHKSDAGNQRNEAGQYGKDQTGVE